MPPRTLEEWHEVAMLLAVECQKKSKTKYDNSPDNIVRAALWVLSHEAVISHRAVGFLVHEGWSSAAASVVRTVLDVLASTLAILNSKDPQLAAFRYFYSGFRYLSRDATHDVETRRSMRDQIRSRIKSLPKEDRRAAITFLRERDRPYWFSDEWRSPADILGRFSLKDFDYLYRQFSAAAHGGFMGQRIFRDRPDDIDINPRLPVGKHGELVLATSTRVVFELCRLRTSHEKLGFTRACASLTEAFNTFGKGGL
jgi:hypothetical protein